MATNGSQTLTTNIKLNAVASGFTDVGSTIGQMGEMIDTLSRKVINFGKESLVVYQDYEKSMTQAEIALSTRYGRGTQELSNVMTSLNEAAADWAKSTIFHTDDVANAILQAARSGWSFEEIMSGIPTVMQLAEAGGIDLSTALDYVVKSMAAYGVETDEMQDFVDMWVFAANSSTGSVETFGDAMLRMGSTMRFTDGKEELFTLIAIMHDMGESGSTAATMLRNAMLRILVPGSKAAGESLDSLMVTGEELEELYSDADLFASMQALEEHGFSAYDEAGKAKPMLQIYSELGDALAKMAGGWDEIAKNEQTLTILKSVFGQRAITGAMDIVMGLGEAYTLQQRLLNGEAEGYGEWSADKMLETLYGRTEIYESKKEELHRRTGEALAGQWESVLETMGGVLDTFNTLDDVKFNAIVKGLESIALLSTGMIATSTALKFIGTVLTPTGALALGLAGLVSAWTVFKELQESDYKMQFGTGELDTATLTTYVQQIGTAFSTAYTQVDSFRAGVDAAQESYKTASSTFASKLFSDMITHASLTDDERTALMNLGNDMYAALQEGITQSTAATLGYWQQLFGGEEVAEDNPAYQEIFALTNTAYENAVAEAKMLSQGLRDALTSAFADGEITQDEYSDLLTYMRNYNDAMARATVEAQREEDFVRMSTWMHKAQTGSYDDILTLAREAAGERDTLLGNEEDRFLSEYYRLQYRGADEETLAAAEAAYAKRRGEISQSYDDFLITLWDSQLNESDMAAQYAQILGIAGEFNAHGGTESQFNTMTAINKTREMGDASGLSRYLINAVWSLGGEKAIEQRISDYDAAGMTEMAERLRNIYYAEQLLTGFATIAFNGEMNPTEIDKMLGMTGQQLVGGGSWDLNTLKSRFGWTGLTDNYSYDSDELSKVPVPYDGSELTNLEPITIPMNADEEQIAAATQSGIETAQDEAENKPVLFVEIPDSMKTLIGTEETLDDVQDYADNNPPEMIFEMPDGQAAGMQFMNGVQGFLNNNPGYGTIYMNPVYGNGGMGFGQGTPPGYAEGGRATRASIFGEAGAEWAIPEEHSARTAELLNAAMLASGFTWPELLARFGGLNGDAGHSPTTIIYSPTINARDARGVEDALAADKRRFERWMEERELRDRIEVYA